MMQPVEVPGQMHSQQAANIIITSNGEIATGDNPNVAGERIVLQPNQRLIIVDPVTGQQKQIQLVQVQPTSSQQAPQHHIMITTQTLASQVPSGDPQEPQTPSRRMGFDNYYVDHQQPSTLAQSSGAHHAQPLTPHQSHHQAQQQPHSGATPPTYATTPAQAILENRPNTEAELARKAKLAESARQRYHRLDSDQKKALNKKRTIAQKRKRQRAKEMAELDALLRQSGDIVDDPDVLEQLREKRVRARWAEAARNRYNRMSEAERRAHNSRRRMRQIMIKNEGGEAAADVTNSTPKSGEKNKRKAEAARLRYHRMSGDEKKQYNRRRTEAFRKRRMEEERLLSMPVGQINEEALDRAQRVVIRNAKRAEAARLRMSLEQRKAYNQRRYTPKSKRASGTPEILDSGGIGTSVVIVKQENAVLNDTVNNFDNLDGSEDLEQQPRSDSAQSFTHERLSALMSLEQEINRQTRQAHQTINSVRRQMPRPLDA